MLPDVKANAFQPYWQSMRRSSKYLHFADFAKHKARLWRWCLLMHEGAATRVLLAFGAPPKQGTSQIFHKVSCTFSLVIDSGMCSKDLGHCFERVCAIRLANRSDQNALITVEHNFELRPAGCKGMHQIILHGFATKSIKFLKLFKQAQTVPICNSHMPSLSRTIPYVKLASLCQQRAPSMPLISPQFGLQSQPFAFASRHR